MAPLKTSISALLISVFLAGQAYASEPRDIGWAELAAPTTPIDNPFEDLTSDQMDTLAQLLQLDILAEEDGDPQAKEDGRKIRRELSAQGIDADYLFAERLRIIAQLEKEGSEPNASLIGETVRVPGYLLPIEMKGDKAVEFLLVPTVGACIHVPPPPANQIIRVSYPEGFPADGYFTPIWITGELRSEFVQQSLYLVDGNTSVAVSYQVEATSVEAYEY